MHFLFEKGDFINTPVECFYFDSETETFPVGLHWHYYMEIIYMIEGQAEMRCGGDTFLLKKGEMILFHPKAVHSIFSADEKTLYYAVFKLDISRMNLTAGYSPKLRSIFRLAEREGTKVIFSAGQTKNMNAEAIFSRCISERKARRYGYDLVIRSEIYKLLIDILRIWQEEGFVIRNEMFVEDGNYDILNITEYIDENMGFHLRVEDIAEKCGMSYSYFAKKFLEIYGKSCKSYMEEMRIYKVEEFLIFTDFDLSYISQETGFSDCSHLINSFRKKTGITPKQYRIKYSRRATKNLPHIIE